MQIADRIFSILEFMAQEPEIPRSLTEIADRIGVAPNTCANIMRALVDRGYAERPGPRRGYILGHMSYMLGRNCRYGDHLIRIAQPHMMALAQGCSENVQLSVLRRGRLILLHQVCGNEVLHINNDFFANSNIFTLAMGRVLLSGAGREDLDLAVKHYGLPVAADWPEVSTLPALQKSLAEVRRCGICRLLKNDGRFFACAAPLIKDDLIIAALGIYMPAYGKGLSEKIAASLQQAAAAITHNPIS